MNSPFGDGLAIAKTPGLPTGVCTPVPAFTSASWLVK